MKNRTEPDLLDLKFKSRGGNLGLSKASENQSFICFNCGEQVLRLNNGSYRNHCPFCLYSLHVDNIPGDRSYTCKGLMKPIGIINSLKK
jgi:DNA-directed RNA polymerase subunit RPC12/RpoP